MLFFDTPRTQPLRILSQANYHSLADPFRPKSRVSYDKWRRMNSIRGRRPCVSNSGCTVAFSGIRFHDCMDRFTSVSTTAGTSEPFTSHVNDRNRKYPLGVGKIEIVQELMLKS
jgi:hypothetical protein